MHLPSQIGLILISDHASPSCGEAVDLVRVFVTLEIKYRETRGRPDGNSEDVYVRAGECDVA